MPQFIIFCICLVIYSCTPTINKSGLIDTDKFSMSFDGLYKNDIIEIIGSPSSIDSLNNSLIYFSEIRNEKNIFNNKVLSRNIYVFKFDKNDYFSNLEKYFIDNKNNITISKKTTGAVLTVDGGNIAASLR